jgi:hypothetical protein
MRRRSSSPSSGSSSRTIPRTPGRALRVELQRHRQVSADGSHKVVFTLKRPSVVILYNLTLFPAFIVVAAAVKSPGAQFP